MYMYTLFASFVPYHIKGHIFTNFPRRSHTNSSTYKLFHDKVLQLIESLFQKRIPTQLAANTDEEIPQQNVNKTINDCAPKPTNQQKQT